MYSTELGKSMRLIRSKRGENLATLSEKYGASIAYLSSIEVGKKAIPDDYIEKINAIYNLDDAELISLQNGVDEVRSKSIIAYDGMDDERKELTKVFARKINTVNQHTLEKLREILNQEA